MPARRPVLALTALALVLRVATIDVQSYWSDEAATVLVLRHSFSGMLHAVWNGESTPPLFYVVDWLWSRLAGTGGIALRLPSAIFGTAAVPVVAALAARVAGPPRAGRAAVFGAALAAVSPLTVWYGQEARAYALLMLLAAGSTLALLRMLDAPSRGRLAAWAALAVAACWAHHFALFLVVGQGLWALWVLRGRALPAVGVVAAGAAALAPLLLHQRDAGRATFIADVPLSTRLFQIPKQVLVGYDAPAELPLTLLGVSAVLVALAGLVELVTVARRRVEAPAGSRPGEAVHFPRPGSGEMDGLQWSGRDDGSVSPPEPAVVVLSVTAVGFALPCLAALVGQDFLLTRNLLGLLPLALALVAAGAAAGAAGRDRPGRLSPPGRSHLTAGLAAIGVLTATGVTCAVAVAVHPGYQRDDFRAAVHAALAGPPLPRLVVTDAAGRLPASLYLGRGTTVVVPGQTTSVREIDVVRVAGAEPGRARSTPALPDGVVPAGFVLVADHHGETWRTRRFVAPIDVAVDPGALGILDPGHAPIVLARPR
ncbi:glycosyltransferase family 39 protein [Paraconexibacter antarcticus]|uniref:Glycosyltransferase family 39 protein n=1 Tax=Paraconexibacter antarcticus TaxID=2949664 RepID=A0ABY5DVB5_9ACTN|nr:glycosyltransferase family 39 protein [Paraconexibacter antarcticus]UTI65002.1 glycosyltransferase family 39 protein [Paraconexibacter antarcticus]